MLRALGGVGLALALAGGCGSTVPGAVHPDPDVPLPATAAELLGEPVGLDPCGLLPEDALDSLDSLDTARRAPADSFDYCDFEVLLADGDTAALRFGALSHAPDDAELAAAGAEELPGVGLTLRVFRQSPSSDFCADLVLFPDEVALDVIADGTDSPGETAGLCDLVGEVTAAVVERLERGGPVDRVDYPAWSVARADACTALTDAAAGAALGLAAPAPRTTYPAGHQCLWGDPTGVPSLSVAFAPGELVLGGGGAQETVAGRPTAVYGVDAGDRSMCLFETAANADELAQVVARLPLGQTEQACAVARTVAGHVWPSLPG